MTDQFPAFGQAPLTGVLPANMSQEALWIAVAEAIGCEVGDLHNWVIVVEVKAEDYPPGVHGKIITSGPGDEYRALRMMRQAAANLGRVLGR